QMKYKKKNYRKLLNGQKNIKKAQKKQRALYYLFCINYNFQKFQKWIKLIAQIMQEKIQNNFFQKTIQWLKKHNKQWELQYGMINQILNITNNLMRKKHGKMFKCYQQKIVVRYINCLLKVNLLYVQSLEVQVKFQQKYIIIIFFYINLLKALPKFIKYAQISNQNQNLEQICKKNKEYPIEVEIGQEFKFHSTFVCPVSRDVVGPDQNIILLACGHVISEQSMKKITANSTKSKFKCPTCPKEMSVKDTKVIYF
ncbi:hypothetical protein IMG5_121220, partial [Ichthyophthirius multifiliis]